MIPPQELFFLSEVRIPFFPHQSLSDLHIDEIRDEAEGRREIVLSPLPSSDPNEPLVSLASGKGTLSTDRGYRIGALHARHAILRSY